MNKEFIHSLYTKHRTTVEVPPSSEICDFTTKLLQLLFPEHSVKKYANEEEVQKEVLVLKENFNHILSNLEQGDNLNKSTEVVEKFFGALPKIYQYLQTDVEAILGGDPAAQSEFEVIRAYPGFYAIAMYRFAHELYELGIPNIPRIITEFAHIRTGIDIHPAAQIGNYFFIDHGTGVVIGGTSIIGNHVKIYQGVTLGALSVDKKMASIKRHPTIEDRVVIYSGATILGGDTVVGANSVIGGNVWLTKSVPQFSVVYHKPQIEVSSAGKRSDIPN